MVSVASSVSGGVEYEALSFNPVNKNMQSHEVQVQLENEKPDFSYMLPQMDSDNVMIVCRAEIDGEVQENKPVYFPGLDWQKDLKMSVLNTIDIKIL